MNLRKFTRAFQPIVDKTHEFSVFCHRNKSFILRSYAAGHMLYFAQIAIKYGSGALGITGAAMAVGAIVLIVIEEA